MQKIHTFTHTKPHKIPVFTTKNALAQQLPIVLEKKYIQIEKI